MQNRKIVGELSANVIQKLDINAVPGTPIYISDSNVAHIRETHSDAYQKYFDHIEDIVAHPDYIGIAGVYKPSIEYIKNLRRKKNGLM